MDLYQPVHLCLAFLSCSLGAANGSNRVSIMLIPAFGGKFLSLFLHINIPSPLASDVLMILSLFTELRNILRAK